MPELAFRQSLPSVLLQSSHEYRSLGLFDFAIACETEVIATDFIKEIDSKMSIEIKYLGLLTRFNGVDIDQTQKYIKISSTTYINKVLSEHDWIDTNKPCHTFPIPITAEASYSRSLEQASPQKEIEKPLIKYIPRT